MSTLAYTNLNVYVAILCYIVQKMRKSMEAELDDKETQVIV